jgi:hypothetical protein
MTENGDSTTARAHGRVTGRTVLKAAGATALAAGAVTASRSAPVPRRFVAPPSPVPQRRNRADFADVAYG